MGSLGKTTLAQLVYNDNLVASQFDSRIAESASSDTECVTDAVKFFFGLDDVWNEDPVEWKKLQDLLTFGVIGSRIVVTTQSKKVVSIMGTVKPYELKGLSDKQCLSILVKWAFKEGEEQNHKDLVDTVREMVKKCGGVPLAARTLGGILQQLIYRWMAQGFIQEKQNEALEDTAECYFDELVRRSFLENANFGRGYKMHDLVHDLAQFVAGNDCLTLNDNIKVVPERVIHVSFNSSLYSEVP
ncbi:disease resistance protein RGA2-like [Actinidia eriantha]|uniref:disease resistance protein RGA2-like n=1 Tax=Actinidia eriantha TaxID=165200 RepID=UPI00258FD405|nr:disease resistance protein RGA2-like [Actinidia eriantha]